MDNKVYYIKANLWQQVFIIQPVEAETEEEARKKFFTVLADKARDVEIEEVITDDKRLEEVLELEAVDDEPVVH